ncbi:hypothetical protein BDZ97DRAFT_1990233 [Flammula alnicola]|nr:hypothetical protein BDZ97DRAFT_1990233 [Flammula alnicola]
MGLSGRKVKQRISADPRNLSWADGSHKLDMLGIGAAQTKDPNGIAWKQNRDFENLLRRLNEKLDDEQTPVEDEKEDDAEDDRRNLDAVVETKSVSVEVKKLVALPRHRAHRARAIAAKNIASKSSAHISEILGLNAPGKLTSVTETDALGMDKIKTSTKSLADYFKEKLDARSSKPGSATPSSRDAKNGAVEILLAYVFLLPFCNFIDFFICPVCHEKDEPMGDTDEGLARISEVESDSETKDRSKKSEKKEKKKRKDITEHEVEKSREEGKKGKKIRKARAKWS